MRIMYDSITLGEIPRNAQAVAGYVGGRWPTYRDVRRIWPRADTLSLAISLEEEAEGLDCERGDVDPTDHEGIHGWVVRALDRGVWRPVLYCSQAYMGTIIRYLEARGIKRSQIRVWSAHYGFLHICSPESCRLPDGQLCDFTADGTQCNNHALGRNLDESILHDDFFHHPAPKPPRKPVPKVSAAGLGGLITAGILAAVHASGVHITPAESGVIDAFAAFLAGYVKRG